MVFQDKATDLCYDRARVKRLHCIQGDTMSKTVPKIFTIIVATIVLIFIGIAVYGQKTNIVDKETSNENEQIQVESLVEEQIQLEKHYPTAWLIEEVDNVPAFKPVECKYLPGANVKTTINGIAQETEYTLSNSDQAIVSYNGNDVSVDPTLLLLNITDYDSRILVDAVYSYSAPSDCAGTEIPGLTNCKVNGYSDGKQYNEYLNRDEYAVPVAYGTFIKLEKAADVLYQQGYRIKIWDAYRPYTASMFISDKFEQAYANDSAIRNGIGGWSTIWYAADGASGHNFGTDIDATLTDLNGEEIEMPSHFDAFDSSAHLCTNQVSSANITPSLYTATVKNNPACLAYHQAMLEAGFSELASEWWHFGDSTTQKSVKTIVGSNGMDFTATLGE